MKQKRYHAPAPDGRGYALCGSEALGLNIAQSGDTINCRACLAQLRSKTQWCNQLVTSGYKVSSLQARPMKGPPSDPRQLWFGDKE